MTALGAEIAQGALEGDRGALAWVAPQLAVRLVRLFIRG